MNTSTRRQAKELGHKKYFTGKFCSRGHIAERNTANGCCDMCVKLDREKWVFANQQCRKETHAKYHAKNKAKRNIQTQKWRKENPSEWRECQQRYRESEHGKVVRNFHRSKRRAELNRALDKTADQTQVKAFYAQARHLTVFTGEKWQVDHLVPLTKGGTHHEGNLVLMRANFNNSKNNKLIDCIVAFFSNGPGLE